jgi:hypothetical protein
MNDDSIVHRLEQWEKRAIAAFLMLAKIVGLSALLIIEVFMISQIWDFEMRVRATTTDLAPAQCGCECKRSSGRSP